ncbi:PTS sorbitol transporter subunit IIB [Streptococcus chenjunshii]|uniref:PTS sorbitol transporter subunit IIB n=1 Tax=Streptococcus chenjunshii TaxID=2173853 RepID=A0A372KLD4_9STRE|nr:PTS glucitol/sorbitol transporter subunit IIB [Streptococcus chenjunshii]AXQ79634.1 PTS sorbitol transporter subunit IIB [Streptococcus chenjunshii]RFU51051.1 PTS sorbitol transporter subunit IIB [Streptococcus chenjunshii]RFU53095.1 PTS sorbitol transporter subunit IIB [Streptococcus chenjunshii]
MTNAVKVSKGEGGWGGPLIVAPTGNRKYVLCVTTGGINPVAKKIGELSGAEVVDQFSTPADTDEVFCAVIDCAGVARCGTYPKLGIPTINVKRGGPSGPLAQYIKEEIFVSGVKEENIELADDEPITVSAQNSSNSDKTSERKSITKEAREKYAASEIGQKNKNSVMDIVNKIGVGVGNAINIIYSAARETVDNMLKNIIPFMLFVSVLIGIINYTGFAQIIANVLTPLAGSLWGLLLLALICSIPFLSPLIVPGAILAQVMSVLVGNQIGAGVIPPQYALPAMYAVNAQVGADFVPVGLTLMEAEPETIEAGVPAFLFSKLITGPFAVIIGYLFSFGL